MRIFHSATYRPLILKSPNPSGDSLVRCSLNKLNTIADKQHPCLKSYTCLYNSRIFLVQSYFNSLIHAQVLIILHLRLGPALIWSSLQCQIYSATLRNKVAIREERIPTRCKNINDLLSIPDVDY